MPLLHTPTHNKGIAHTLLRNRAFAGLVLAAFVFMRAIVPSGFMPSDGSSGSFYMLCYSAKGAAQLAALGAASDAASHDHAQHHNPIQHTTEPQDANQSSHHAHQQSQNTPCAYATFNANIAFGVMLLLVLVWPSTQRSRCDIRRCHRSRKTYLLPAVRAPPPPFIA